MSMLGADRRGSPHERGHEAELLGVRSGRAGVGPHVDDLAVTLAALDGECPDAVRPGAVALGIGERRGLGDLVADRDEGDGVRVVGTGEVPLLALAVGAAGGDGDGACGHAVAPVAGGWGGPMRPSAGHRPATPSALRWRGWRRAVAWRPGARLRHGPGGRGSSRARSMPTRRGGSTSGPRPRRPLTRASSEPSPSVPARRMASSSRISAWLRGRRRAAWASSRSRSASSPSR